MGSRLRHLAIATGATLTAAMAFASPAAAVPVSDISYSAGVLQIYGNQEDNIITVSYQGSKIKITESNPTSGLFVNPVQFPGCMNSDPQTVLCDQDPPDPPSPRRPSRHWPPLSVALGDGNDTFTNLTSLGSARGGVPQ